MLGEDELMQWAIVCTQLRSSFRNSAFGSVVMDKGREIDEDGRIARLAAAIEKRELSDYNRLFKKLKSAFQEETPVGRRRRGKKPPKISTSQKLEIADRVVRGCEAQADLAKEFRISQSRVCNIVAELKKRPEVIREQISQESEQALLDEQLANFVETKLLNGELIEKADDIRTAFEADTGIKVKVYRVRRVMRELLELRYKKIVKLPVHGNSERCLVQRQQCALVFLQFRQAGKRFINIDESWVGSGDYRRRSWQRKGVSNSLPAKKVSPRITLILALDSEAKIYCSLLQANSDEDTMKLFLTELVRTLDYEDRQWRQNTVLMWDNAGYHEAGEVLTLLKEQRVPVMYLGPYSYHMAPCEMVFAALKVQWLNQDQAPLGKK